MPNSSSFSERLTAARKLSWRHHGKSIIFYLPGMFRLDGATGRYPALSITGGECALGCDHCQGKILSSMIYAESAEKLVSRCRQLARYLIDEDLSHAERFRYDEDHKITDFGVPAETLEAVISTGEPIRTSGCQGYDGQVACNRPFANSRPGPEMRNYPFPPTESDIELIREQLYQPQI